MINYQNLADSITFYEKLDFKRIESPWTVTDQVNAITKPEDKIDFKLQHNGKCLVGSGEQSFLYLYLKGFLPKGKYQTITPCFRFENFDFLHTKYFMKNELIITDQVTEDKLNFLIGGCLDFFSKYFNYNKLSVFKTENGFDIECSICDKKYELGSYGIRQCEFLKWIYGTGCAEPRLSNLIELDKK